MPTRKLLDSYCAISHGTGQDRELRRAFQRLPGLGVEPALPLFLRLYREWMVDIIPLRHQLRCYLNTTREQLSDPHGMIDRCRDPLLRQDSHGGSCFRCSGLREAQTRWRRLQVRLDPDPEALRLAQTRIWRLSPHFDRRRSGGTPKRYRRPSGTASALGLPSPGCRF